MNFLQIVFALKQFIVCMDGKPVPIIAFPTPRGSLTDEERVLVQKIANALEQCLKRAMLGLPGGTPAEQLSI